MIYIDEKADFIIADLYRALNTVKAILFMRLLLIFSNLVSREFIN